MFSIPQQVKIFASLEPTDMRRGFGTPGQAWQFQRVRFPPRKGERAAPPGIESWAYGGNDMSQV